MIYFLRNPRNGHIKIGISTLLRQRFRNLVSHHGTLELLGLMEGGEDTEKQLHAAFADERITSGVSGSYEWYEPSKGLRAYIKYNCDVKLTRKLKQAVSKPTRKKITRNDLFSFDLELA